MMVIGKMASITAKEHFFLKKMENLLDSLRMVYFVVKGSCKLKMGLILVNSKMESKMEMEL